MKTAAIADLKARLSRFLSLVKAGEEILVTERGTPIARLVPVAPAGDEIEGLRELERKGFIRLGSGKLPERFWKLQRGEDPEASVRRAVTEERERGW
jgi:prevent-host-death family protein